MERQIHLKHKNKSVSRELRVHFGEPVTMSSDSDNRKPILKNHMQGLLLPLDKFKRRNIVLDIIHSTKSLESKLGKKFSVNRSSSMQKLKPRLLLPMEMKYFKKFEPLKLQFSSTLYCNSRNYSQEPSFTDIKKKRPLGETITKFKLRSSANIYPHISVPTLNLKIINIVTTAFNTSQYKPAINEIRKKLRIPMDTNDIMKIN